MKPQFSADLIARQRLLMEREAIAKGEFDLEKWGQGAAGGGRGNIFTAQGRDLMARNKQAGQYNKLSPEGQKAFREAAGGQANNPSAGAGSRGGSKGNWAAQMYGEGGTMQMNQNAVRDARRMGNKMSLTPGAPTPGAGQADVNPNNQQPPAGGGADADGDGHGDPDQPQPEFGNNSRVCLARDCTTTARPNETRAQTATRC